MNLLKKSALVVFFFISTVLAADIPLDPHLTSFSTQKGIGIWFREDNTTSLQVACRFVTQDPIQKSPHILTLDCPTEVFESELPIFLDYCGEESEKQGWVPLGVVVVGNVDLPRISQILENNSVFNKNPERVSNGGENIQFFASNETSNAKLFLSYPAPLCLIGTENDLKHLWATYLIQAMTEARLQQVAISFNEHITFQTQKYLLPNIATVGYGVVENGEGIKLLTSFLGVIKTLKEHGFSDSELSSAKSKLQKQIEHRFQTQLDPQTLADYYASCLAVALPCPKHEDFANHSLQIIPNITLYDISQKLEHFFNDEDREVIVKFPEKASIPTKEEIRDTLGRFSSANLVLWRQPTNEGAEKDPFLQLPMTEKEEEQMREVIQTVGSVGYVELLFIQGRVRQKGDELRHLHPFNSLAAIFSDPYTVECMAKIANDYMKWRGFIDDFGKQMKREFDRDNLLPYVPGLCQFIKANPEQIKNYINNLQWDLLIKYLIKLKTQS